MVKLLLSRPECIVNVQDSGANTPLHIACNSLNDPIIRWIKESGRAELDVVNKDDRRAADVLSHKSK